MHTRQSRAWLWMLHHAGLLRAVGVMLAAAIIAWAIAYLISQSQRTAELRACEAQNIIRASNNDNSYEDWKVFKLVISEQDARRVPANEREPARAFKTLLDHDIALKTWTPLTNCHAAVYDGASPKPAVRFSSSEPPGASKPSAALSAALRPRN